MVLLLGALFLSVVCLIGIALLVRALTANQVEVVRALARKVEAQAALAIATAPPAPAPEPVPATPETRGCEGCGNCRSTAQVPEKEQFETLPNGSFVRSADYETRADGKRVRKDRWETGMRNIATILTGPRNEFEIDDLVEKVRVLAQSARADYESGGNGIPGSAPVWGPCPAQCDGGLVVMKGIDTDCPTCEGRGRVVVEPALAPAEEAK
jgi:hypothetical protein